MVPRNSDFAIPRITFIGNRLVLASNHMFFVMSTRMVRKG